MKSNLIAGKSVPEFDSTVVVSLKLESDSDKAARAERMRIGIRNENGEIYRAIGITGLNKFLSTINSMNELGFKDELEDADGPKGGYDAIFKK